MAKTPDANAGHFVTTESQPSTSWRRRQHDSVPTMIKLSLQVGKSFKLSLSVSLTSVAAALTLLLKPWA